MKPNDPYPAFVPQSENQSGNAQPADSSDKLVSRRSRSQRQLKDYPQSLQTAARALWG